MKYDSTDLEMGASEIEQKTEPQSRGPNIVQALLTMRPLDAPDRFDFYDDAILHKHVGYVVAYQHALVMNLQRDLLMIGKAAAP